MRDEWFLMFSVIKLCPGSQITDAQSLNILEIFRNEGTEGYEVSAGNGHSKRSPMFLSWGE